MAKKGHLIVKEAEALIVGPDEKLILHLSDEFDDELVADLHEALDSIGLAKRSLILVGEVEFAKVRE